MSNLSDLIPAGASAKQLTFTDSGSGITTKKPVILNSDGTVVEAGEITYPIGTGSATNYTGSSDEGNYVNIAYDTVNDKMLLVYTDSSTGYGTGVVGTVSGTTLSWGTPVVFQSAGLSYPWVAFDTSAEKFLIVFRESGLGYGMVGTISGTSVSYAGKTRVDGGSTYYGYGGLAYDSNAAATVLIFYDSSTGAEATVSTISGSTITTGTSVSFGSGTSDYPLDITYDSTAQKVISCWQGASSEIRANVGTVSGTSISFGSELNTGLASNGQASVSYDPVQDKTLLYFNETSGSQTGYLAVMTVTGTSLGIGSYVANTTGGEGYIIARYNAASASHVIAWSTGSAGKARDVTISGTTPTLDATTTDWSTDYLDYIGMAYDPDQKVMVIGAKNDVAPLAYSIVYRSVYTATNLTATNFVGVADSAISASAAGSVIVQGGTISGDFIPVAAVSFGTASSPASQGMFNTRMAYDSTSNKIVLAYEDSSSSNYGTAVIGTVSGTSISWGTPVVFNSASTADGSIDVVYDPDQDKSVIVYRDLGNSGYGTAIVGTVSGTSISFGSEVVFSTRSSYYINATYDSGQDKVLIVFADGSAPSYTYDGYMIVGTVSGTSISFGSEVQFESSAVSGTALAVQYDAAASKSLVLYAVSSANYAASITISSTTPSIGTKNNWASTSARNTEAVYVASSSKCVFAYSTTAANTPSFSAVTTIDSGTGDVTVATSTSIVTETAQNERGLAYDIGGALFLYVYNATSNNLAVALGSISGDSVTWGSPTVLDSSGYASANFPATVYNSTEAKTVIAYRNASDSQSVVATVTQTTPLTVGTKYYVTTTGGFSSSADTPSVNAGLAISTTSLLLNGDS